MNPTRAELESYIRQTAAAHRLDPELGIRQCDAESSFNPAARSSCGAEGLFQLMPVTAASLGVQDAYDWKQNTLGWAEYMSRLLRQFNGRMDQALAAYNWGPGNLARLVKSNPEGWRARLPRETADYLRKILG